MKNNFLNVISAFLFCLNVCILHAAEQPKIDLDIVGATEIEKKADEGWLRASAQSITEAMKKNDEKSAKFNASTKKTDRKYLCGIEKNEDGSYLVAAEKQ